MKLILIDRDGVINEDSDAYIKSEAEWKAIPGSLEAIAELSQNDYHVVVVSNQSGIGRKLFTIEDLNRIHQKMIAELAHFGGKISAIFFCPHTPKNNCDCRKPGTGLFKQISERLRMPLDNVSYIGDKLSDIEVAEQVNAKPILVKTGYGEKTLESDKVPTHVPVYENLAEAVINILQHS